MLLPPAAVQQDGTVGRLRWATLALVIDCHTRELLGWHLSVSGWPSQVEASLSERDSVRFSC